MPLVRLQGVAWRHPAGRGTPALAGLDLSIAPGEALAVIGPSGAGKTTLLHGIALALRPLAGEVEVFGRRAWPRPARSLRGRLFLAPQTPPLPPRQRVVTAVSAGALPQQSLLTSLRSLFYPSDIDGARAALARFELADKLFDRVDRLSGGERQRVGLARALVALVHGCEMLLVDEPLSALDPTRAAQAVAALLDATRERGAALVCSLHQVEVALASFARVVGLRDGRIAFDAPAAQVSQAMLHELYADRESELFGPTPLDDVPDADEVAARPRIATCR